MIECNQWIEYQFGGNRSVEFHPCSISFNLLFIHKISVIPGRFVLAADDGRAVVTEKPESRITLIASNMRRFLADGQPRRRQATPT